MLDSSASLATSENLHDQAPDLKFPYATCSNFWNVGNYKTYRLINLDQSYNENFSGRTGKYSERMETVEKS